MPDQVNRICRFHHIGGHRQGSGINTCEELLQGGYVPCYKITKKRHLSFPDSSEFRRQRPHTCVESRGRRRQSPLEHCLQVLEPLVAE